MSARRGDPRHAPAADRAAAATWDRLAARYAAQERGELRAVDRALDLAAPACGDRLVDLGTGSALVLRRLAGRPGAPHAAVGVDRSAAMLARAGALPDGWRLLRADARAVALPDGWADVVTCAYVLHLLAPADRAALLAEARRLLRPGPRARLVVVTIWSSRRWAAAALSRLADARPARWGGLAPLDPTADLVAAGFAPARRAAVARGGYPSLVVVARPAARDPRSGPAADPRRQPAEPR